MQKRFLSSPLRKIVHKDFDIAFKRHPTTGKLLMKKDDEAIKQAVKNLVMTNRFERPFHPEFGGNIRARLFDNFNSITKAQFETMINMAISNYEPRVKLESENGQETIMIKEYPNENAMAITIRFRNVSTLNDLTLDVNLNRIR